MNSLDLVTFDFIELSRVPPRSSGSSEWGGKSLGLKKLKKAGFRVPITTVLDPRGLYRWLSGFHGFERAVQSWKLWESEESKSPLALEEFRQFILAASPPEDWKKSSENLWRFFKSNRPTRLMIRSNMSAEDCGAESFAGAYLSKEWDPQRFDSRSLWKAICEVVASAYTRDAALRFLSAGLDPSGFLPGVLIQEKINPVLAGVCFSRAPQNLWEGRGSVEWIEGVGENLVQGRASTHTLYQDENPEADSPLSLFWDKMWRDVSQAEKILGCPADLEWAWDGKRIWWLQLRPIATEDARLIPHVLTRRARWSRELSQERFPEPMTLLGWTVIEDMLEPGLESLWKTFGIGSRARFPMAIRRGGWIYSDPDFFRFPANIKIHAWKYMQLGAGYFTGAFKAAGHFLWAHMRGKDSRVARALFSLDVAFTMLGPQARRIHLGWKDLLEKSLAQLNQFDTEIRGAGERVGEPYFLLEKMQGLREISLELLDPDLPIFLVKDTLRKAAQTLWRSLKLPDAEFPDLVSSFSENRTLEMGRDWDMLIRKLQKDLGCMDFIKELSCQNPEADWVLGSEARDIWRGFLRVNGHNRTSWDVARPGWAQDVSVLRGLIESSLCASESSLKRPSGKEPRERARSHLLDRLEKQGYSSAGCKVGAVLKMLEDFMRMDEELHFFTGRLLEPSRYLILRAGELLEKKNLIFEAQDVFHLSLDELKNILRNVREAPTHRFLARRRRSEWERIRAEAQPPSILPFNGSEPQSLPQDGTGVGNVIRGQPMSSGTVEGRVYFIEHLDQVFDLPRGAVLVTTSPNPAFVPIYPLLGGMVCATGGMLSHGFIAAREFGIPAVSGIQELSRKLKPGDWVRLDGSQGHVEVLSGNFSQ